MKRHPQLSSKEALVLEILAAGSELYGLELVGRSRGELKRGTVYVTLGRMEQKGYVTARHEERGPNPRAGLPRRLYRATALGLGLLRVYGQSAAILAGATPR